MEINLNQSKEFQKEIRDHIVKDELDTALNKLRNFVQYGDKDLMNSVLMLSGRFNKLKRDKNLGLLSPEVASITRNQIASAIIELTKELEIDQTKFLDAEVKNFIGRGDIKEAIEKLVEHTKNQLPELQNEAILLQARYAELERRLRLNTISEEEGMIENNRLTSATLEFLNTIESLSQTKFDRTTLSEQPTQSRSVDDIPAQEISQSKTSPFTPEQQRELSLEEKIAAILNEPVEDLYAGLDRVQLIFGDMFEADFDLIAIPVSESGDISGNVLSSLEKLGIKYKRVKQDLGQVSGRKIKTDTGQLYIAYSTSVRENNTSDLDAIAEIGRKLGALTRPTKDAPDGYKTVVCPLLGTGSGKLAPYAVYQRLKDGFLETATSDAECSIHVLSKEIFDNLYKQLNPFSSDEPVRPNIDADSIHDEDQLDIMHEVEAFARMISSSDLEPPLSIGLFGNWGSGKSFFMNKLHKEVEKIAAQARAVHGESGYHRHIVQIQFNAWYYIDANLWANLVTKIFEGLSKYLGVKTKEELEEITLFEKLSTTKELVVEAEKEVQRIEVEKNTIDDQIERLNQEKEEKRALLRNIKFQDFYKEIVKDDEVKKFIEKAQERLQFEETQIIQDTIEESVAEVNGLINRYNTTTKRAEEILGWYAQKKNRWPRILLLLFILIPLLFYFFSDDLLSLINVDWIEEQLVELVGIVSGISLFIGRLVKDARPILTQFNKGLDYLNTAKTRLINLEKVATSQIDHEVEMLQLEYERLSELEQKAIERKWEAEKEQKKIEEEIEALKEGRKITNWLEKRLTSGDYQKHLGIVSLIREDFSRLSEYLPEQMEKALTDIDKTNRIERIILYIDDLDRCPPDKVVDVLQAIHLLLAFKLFVVVVGVDVRWISKSLLKKYGEMLSGQDKEEIKDEELVEELKAFATPFDYLEKIFQIPFRLKTMSQKDKRTYIKKLLANDVLSEPSKPDAESGLISDQSEKPVANIQSNEKPLSVKPTEAEDIPVEEKETPPAEEKVNIAEQGKEEQPSTDPAKPERLLAELLKLSQSEYQFIQELAAIAGDSPRRIKRFINIARLIKANKRWIPKAEQEDELINTKPYHAILVLLAVVIGSPWMAPFFFDKLLKEKEAETLGQFVAKTELKSGDKIDDNNLVNREWDQFVKYLNQTAESKEVDVQAIGKFQMKYLKKVVPIVIRFSFRSSLLEISPAFTQGEED